MAARSCGSAPSAGVIPVEPASEWKKRCTKSPSVASTLRGEAGARSVLVAQERAGDYRSVPVRVLEEAGGQARLEADLPDGSRVLVLEGGQ